MEERATRSRSRAALVALLIVAILGLGAGAYAVAASIFRPGPSTPAAGNTSAEPSPAPATSAKKPHPLRARITAISGSTWTVQPSKGGALSVIVSDQTKFGSKKAPTTSADFPVGTRVAIVGPRVGDRIQATRIMIPQTRPSAAPSG